MNDGSRDRHGGSGAGGPGCFPDTRWSAVMLAGDSDMAGVERALEQLCQSYWQPIYSFLRRRGYGAHDGEDLTQQFFLRLLERNSMARADRGKGRFRNFLLGALQHFLTDEMRKRAAQKRGGAVLPFPADFAEAEARYQQEPDPNLTPEQMYDRRWAASQLQQALQNLAEEFETAGLRGRFDALKPFLARQPSEGEYDRLGSQLGLTAQAVSAAVYRLRQRYRQLVRGLVADTVAAKHEIDLELTQLFG